MLKVEELTQPNSCLRKAEDDEPIFVILGRDPAATFAIREWIRIRIQLGKNQGHDAQIQDAHDFTSIIADYQDKKGIKIE